MGLKVPVAHSDNLLITHPVFTAFLFMSHSVNPLMRLLANNLLAPQVLVLGSASGGDQAKG